MPDMQDMTGEEGTATWSYSPSITTPVDQVRLFIGDTVGENPQISNEEIAFLLSQESQPMAAAVLAADSIAARYAPMIDFAMGDVKQSLMQLQLSWEKVADRLRRQINRRGVSPFVGGLSIQHKLDDSQQSDLVQPIFQKEMQSEPATTPDGTPEWEIGPFPY